MTPQEPNHLSRREFARHTVIKDPMECLAKAVKLCDV